LTGRTGRLTMLHTEATMKLMRILQYGLIAVVLALPMAKPADATVVLAKSDNIVGDVGAKVYDFTIASGGEYTASLIDLAFPEPFSFLGMMVSHTGGASVGSVKIPPSFSPAGFSFDASPGDYTLQVIGTPSGIPLVGTFSVQVASGAAATVGQVPEPTTWLVLVAGIGVVGAMRLRNRKQRG
jgi:hypothetical protein